MAGLERRGRRLRVDTASSGLQAADVRAAIRRLPAAKTVAGPLRRIGGSVYGVVVSPLRPETRRSRRENFCRRTSGVGRRPPIVGDLIRQRRTLTSRPDLSEADVNESASWEIAASGKAADTAETIDH